MTNILLLPRVTFQTETPNNADMLDTICTFQLGGSPIDLTGISFRAMVRQNPADPGVLLDAQTTNWVSSDAPAGNGWLVSGGTSGQLSWAVPQTKIAAMLVGVFSVDILARADGRYSQVGKAASTFTVVAANTRWSPQI